VLAYNNTLNLDLGKVAAFFAGLCKKEDNLPKPLSLALGSIKISLEISY